MHNRDQCSQDFFHWIYVWISQIIESAYKKFFLAILADFLSHGSLILFTGFNTVEYEISIKVNLMQYKTRLQWHIIAQKPLGLSELDT